MAMEIELGALPNFFISLAIPSFQQCRRQEPRKINRLEWKVERGRMSLTKVPVLRNLYLCIY